MRPSLFHTALLLAAISMVGPFAIDMFLPALPAISADLGATETAVQGTISFYFLAFGLAQMIYGPWSDMVGRKQPIYVGLSIFTLGSLGAALAPNITLLIIARMVQGLGGAVTMVVPRAIIRDQFTGHEATRMMALIMMVISVSPMLAPITGSGVIALFGWRGVFAALMIAALICLGLALVLQRETLAPENRVPVDFGEMARGAKRLLTSKNFLGLTFIGAFGMGSFFVFIAFAPFVYRDVFGVTPTQFSLLFAFNSFGFIGASQLAGPLSARLGDGRLMRLGTLGFMGFTGALFLLSLSGFASLPVITAFLLMGNAFMGLVIPTSMVLALEDHGDIAGLASSLGGTLQMLSGGLVVVLAGPFFDGSAGPMLGAIAVCAALSFVLARTAFRAPSASAA